MKLIVYPLTMRAVGREHTAEVGEIDSWHVHQHCQPCYEIQGLEDDVHGCTNAAGAGMRRSYYMGGTVAIRRLKLLAYLALHGQ
jgi:hypothetical protein